MHFEVTCLVKLVYTVCTTARKNLIDYTTSRTYTVLLYNACIHVAWMLEKEEQGNHSHLQAYDRTRDMLVNVSKDKCIKKIIMSL